MFAACSAGSARLSESLSADWQIEGLATCEESALTGEGRLHAGDFRAIEREAARAGVIEPLDRMNGGLTDWPAGSRPTRTAWAFTSISPIASAQTLAGLPRGQPGALPYFGSGHSRASTDGRSATLARLPGSTAYRARRGV